MDPASQGLASKPEANREDIISQPLLPDAQEGVQQQQASQESPSAAERKSAEEQHNTIPAPPQGVQAGQQPQILEQMLVDGEETRVMRNNVGNEQAVPQNDEQPVISPKDEEEMRSASTWVVGIQPEPTSVVWKRRLILLVCMFMTAVLSCPGCRPQPLAEQLWLRCKAAVVQQWRAKTPSVNTNRYDSRYRSCSSVHWDQEYTLLVNPHLHTPPLDAPFYRSSAKL